MAKKRTQAELLRDAKASLLKTQKGMRASQQRHARPAGASGNWMQRAQEMRKAAVTTLSKSATPTKKPSMSRKTATTQKGMRKAGLTKQEIARFSKRNK